MFTKHATFFNVPADLISRGIILIKDLAKDLSKYYKNESAICIVYIVNQYNKPQWELQDYFENCLIPLNYTQIVRAYKAVANKYPNYRPISWKKPQEQIEFYAGRSLYPIIVNRLYGQKKRKAFTRKQLNERTRNLMDLADLYCINSGKKARPQILVAAMIAALSLYVEKMNKKNVRKVSCFRKFDFRTFRSVCTVDYTHFLDNYKEYISFLYACAKAIPSTKNCEKRYVHYYLTDILFFFGKREGLEKPALSLTDEQFSVFGYQTSKEAREKMEAILNQAKKNKENETIPADQKSMVYYVYKILVYGYPPEDILQWTEGYIRGLAHRIELRKDSNLQVIAQMDLNRKDVDEQDMSDTEIENYLN